jgi:hypothetical protein
MIRIHEYYVGSGRPRLMNKIDTLVSRVVVGVADNNTLERRQLVASSLEFHSPLARALPIIIYCKLQFR